LNQPCIATNPQRIRICCGVVVSIDRYISLDARPTLVSNIINHVITIITSIIGVGPKHFTISIGILHGIAITPIEIAVSIVITELKVLMVRDEIH